MMKKQGFTLAEVLITLAIIGVVATITLPSLMSNTQEQQAVTAFRKAMNTLNEVAQMNAAVDGFDYSGIATTTTPSTADVYDNSGVLNQSIWGMMASKAQVDANRSGFGSTIIPTGCDGLDYVIFFRDGTALCYDGAQRTNNSSTDVIRATIDTNGRKAPNAISQCGEENCTNKENKRIRDQFRITLYKAMAVPGRITVSNNGGIIEGTQVQDYAARWAMSK